MSDMHDWGVSETARQLRSKAVSSVEVTMALLARAQANEALGSFLHLDVEGALAQAKQADAQLSAGAQGRLLGVALA